MIYKEFGKTGVKLSALGFGAMRFPMRKDDENEVDDELAIPMIHRAFELGVNYIDSAPSYCEGKSEQTVGKALKGWRDKVYVSTKQQFDDSTYDGFLRRLDGSLKRLDVDHIDFYHFWGIGLKQFKEEINVKGGPITAALKAKEQGLIKHLSFSYHDDPENQKEIVDSGYFESVLMQYNILDRSNEENIAYCSEKGLGVAIMGPVGGGRLGSPEKTIRDMLNGKVKSSAEAALRFVLSTPGVNVAVSGMRTIEMVEENAKIASSAELATPAERKNVEEILEEIKRLSELYCTGCNYCMPCPNGIDIPRIFEIMNYKRVYGLTGYAKREYAEILKPESKKAPASACVECGKCEAKCPQKIEIIRQLKESHEALV